MQRESFMEAADKSSCKAIVELLRDRAYSSKFPDPLLEKAADCIEQLAREVFSRPREVSQ